MLFTACNKDSSISKDPVYIKMIGKWVECGNKSSTIEFKKNGEVKIDRLLERNHYFKADVVIPRGLAKINEVPWNSYALNYAKNNSDFIYDFSFRVNNNWDSITIGYGTKIDNTTSTPDYLYYTKE